jgi:hypothetical protein
VSIVAIYMLCCSMEYCDAPCNDICDVCNYNYSYNDDNHDDVAHIGRQKELA